MLNQYSHAIMPSIGWWILMQGYCHDLFESLLASRMHSGQNCSSATSAFCGNVWVIEWVSAAICFENLACQICRHRSFSCLLYSFFALYSKTFCTWLLWNIIVVRIEGFKLAFIILSIIFRNLVGFFGYVPGCLNPVFCSHLLIWWVGDDFVNWFVEGCCHGQWCKLRRHLPPSRMFMQL